MLDTRGLRDRQAAANDTAAIAGDGRTLLGEAQEAWLFDRLRASHREGARWRLIGQQVMFSPLVAPGGPILLPDTWDGYRSARTRVLDFLDAERVPDVAILSGDVHSSWAFDVPRNPWSGYRPATGAGSLAVELLTPAISSPPLFSDPMIRERAPAFGGLLPHLRFLDGDSRGYVLIDITRDRLRGEWYFVPDVRVRSAAEERAAAFVCERGSSRLVEA
jgi:alkaline phosphatase D